MDRKRLLLAGGLIIVAFFLFTQVQKMATPVTVEVPVESTEPVVEQIEYVDVLVSTTEVPFGTRLNESHMRWKQWPAEAVTPDFISSADRPQAINELSGSVVRSLIYENEPISERKIVAAGERGLMASLLASGMRGVSTRISVDTAVGGFIQPGDRVDIILTTQSQPNPMSPGFNTGQPVFSAQTIFENVRVMAIDQIFSTSSDSGATVIGSTATFEMTQRDAEILQMSAAQGDISLSLRPMSSAGTTPGTSTAKVQHESNEVSSVSVYRSGEMQSVAIKGQ